MRVKSTAAFDRDYGRLPQAVKDAFRKQIELLLRDPRHPSLNIKKMKGFPNIWRAKITAGYRFTFQVDRDCYVLRRFGAHDVLRTP